MSTMITRSFVGDRALVRLTGMPGFPFPSYQLPTSSIRQSEAHPATGAWASTIGACGQRAVLGYNTNKLVRDLGARKGLTLKG